MKKAKTYRMDEKALENLEVLVSYFSNLKTGGITKKVSYADVLEYLINEKAEIINNPKITKLH